MSNLTHGGDDTSGLSQLGSGSLVVPPGGPVPELLEIFPNRFPGRPYIVTFSYPEYTSLCPMTGQPDFGTIRMEYIPHEYCVESKSFKLYMLAYRNHQAFMESLTNTVLDHMVERLSPLWCRISGLFAPRGATHIHVYAEHFAELDRTVQENMEMMKKVRSIVYGWKRENHQHEA